MPAGLCEASSAVRPHPAGGADRAGGPAGPRRCRAQRSAGLRGRDPGRDRDLDAGVCRAVCTRWAGARSPARSLRQPELAERARAARGRRARRRSTRATSRRRSSTGSATRGGIVTARGPGELRRSSAASRSGRTTGARGADQSAPVGRRDPDRARARTARRGNRRSPSPGPGPGRRHDGADAGARARPRSSRGWTTRSSSIAS